FIFCIFEKDKYSCILGGLLLKHKEKRTSLIMHKNMNDFIMFIDTETSGLPKDWDNPNEDWPYVIQLSWIVYNKQGKLIKEEDHYIYDEHIVIDPQSEEVHHITKTMLEEKGEKRLKVLKRILR